MNSKDHHFLYLQSLAEIIIYHIILYLRKIIKHIRKNIAGGITIRSTRLAEHKSRTSREIRQNMQAHICFIGRKQKFSARCSLRISQSAIL
jgi:hypothetical protein